MLTEPRNKVIGKNKVVGELERFDERDNVQSRNQFEPGSADYMEFYARHPEWEYVDAETRELSKKRVGNPLDFLFFLQVVGATSQRGRESEVDGPVASEKFELSPERAAEKIKGFARHLGADLVRIGPLNPAFVYTHVGKTWNDPARRVRRPDHSHASTRHQHRHRPKPGDYQGRARAFDAHRDHARLQQTGYDLHYARGLYTLAGLSGARHVVHNYQVLRMPIAIEAGMGELGRARHDADQRVGELPEDNDGHDRSASGA